MCGIAGIIYRTGVHGLGADMTRMLQSMKHRGPDSTGFALYGDRQDTDTSIVMRYTLADANDPRDYGFSERLETNRREVESRLAAVGATIEEAGAETEYAHRVVLSYAGDVKALADYVEDVPGCEVL